MPGQPRTVTAPRGFRVTGSHVIQDDAPDPPAAGSPVRGCEDCRLSSLNGRLHATCTVRDRDPRARCEIALLDIEPDGRVTAAHPERSYNAHLHQKNWMPLVRDGALYFVYGCDPTVILQYDFDTRQAREIGRHHPPLALDHLRGGSQALAVPGGWLCLVHEVTVLPGGRRVYLHRFVHLDEGLRISALSEPFHFISRGIEFCAGLVRKPGTDRCHISFGVDDARAFVATFSLAAALALCRPVDTLTVSAHRARRVGTPLAGPHEAAPEKDAAAVRGDTDRCARIRERCPLGPLAAGLTHVRRGAEARQAQDAADQQHRTRCRQTPASPGLRVTSPSIRLVRDYGHRSPPLTFRGVCLCRSGMVDCRLRQDIRRGAGCTRPRQSTAGCHTGPAGGSLWQGGV